MTASRDPRLAHAVLLNPASNAGRGYARWKDLIATDYGRAKGLHAAELFDGTGPGGIEGLDPWLTRRLLAGDRNFVAAGGDGTVNLALNALLRARTNLGLERFETRFGAVGLGSSNDFQKPYSSARFTWAGRETEAGVHCRIGFDGAFAHDVGRVRLKEDGGAVSHRHFIINASVGVTAEANWEFNAAGPLLSSLKRHWVDGAIIATALKTFARYRNFPVRLAIDGHPGEAVEITNLGVVKNVHFSGQMRYDVPQAPNDGQFGVHLCAGLNTLEMVRLLAALNMGKFTGRRKTRSHQAREVRVSADQSFALETDGEVTRVREAAFELLAKETLICP